MCYLKLWVRKRKFISLMDKQSHRRNRLYGIRNTPLRDLRPWIRDLFSDPYTVERRLSGYLLSGCPVIRVVEKWQINTNVTLRCEEDFRKKKTKFRAHNKKHHNSLTKSNILIGKIRSSVLFEYLGEVQFQWARINGASWYRRMSRVICTWNISESIFPSI